MRTGGDGRIFTCRSRCPRDDGPVRLLAVGTLVALLGCADLKEMAVERGELVGGGAPAYRVGRPVADAPVAP